MANISVVAVGAAPAGQSGSAGSAGSGSGSSGSSGGSSSGGSSGSQASGSGTAGPLIPKPRPILYLIAEEQELPDLPALRHFTEFEITSLSEIPSVVARLQKIRAAMGTAEYTIILYCRDAAIPSDAIVAPFKVFDDRVRVTLYRG
jgi:hypothetical protein